MPAVSLLEAQPGADSARRNRHGGGARSRAERAVARAGKDDEVEILVGLDQGVDHLHRRGRIDVVVQFADGQQELALQLVGVGRRSNSRRTPARPASPSTPRSTRSCPCDCRGSRSRRRPPCRSRREKEAPRARFVRRRRAAVDPDARQVHRGSCAAAAAFIQSIRSGKPASPRFFQQTSWNALRPPVGPHAVDLHDDEPELRQRLLPGEAAANGLGTNAPCGPA